MEKIRILCYGDSNTFDFILYEIYYPASEVVATKHDNFSVTVEWDMDRALTGYNVYRQNIHLDDAKLVDVNITSTSYTDDEWYNLGAGVYKWGVASVYEVNNVDGKNVLSWVLPDVVNNHEYNGSYMQYDDMTNIDGVGMFHQGSFYWAVMFPAEALAPYVGQKLMKVSTFDYAAHDGELSIYVGGTSAPLNLVHSQSYVCSGSKDYIEFDLTESIAIANDNIWIVFYNYNGQYIAPAGVNTGDPNGRWISVDGVQWYDVYLDTGYDYTWNIRAYLNYEGEYPGMEKDMAFVLDKDITAGEVMTTIKKAGGRLLTDIDVFDVYTGENVSADKKSIAFNLTFQDPTRTLTEEEVMTVFNNIIDKVKASHNAELRDK
mgnify:CR=1 FL=1